MGFDPFASGLPDYIEQVPLQTIWKEADAISLHCPLTDENRSLINEQVLAACKRGLILVNTARGGLIDETALLKAIHIGQVAAAGLDRSEEHTSELQSLMSISYAVFCMK